MTLCKKCQKKIQEVITGCHKVEGGFMCDGCYYSELGDLVEQHPITSPRSRRASGTK